jgi:hypothetical protein
MQVHIKTLKVKHPLINLIMTGEKDVENRSRNTSPSYRVLVASKNSCTTSQVLAMSLGELSCDKVLYQQQPTGQGLALLKFGAGIPYAECVSKWKYSVTGQGFCWPIDQVWVFPNPVPIPATRGALNPRVYHHCAEFLDLLAVIQKVAPDAANNVLYIN